MPTMTTATTFPNNQLLYSWLNVLLRVASIADADRSRSMTRIDRRTGDAFPSSLSVASMFLLGVG